MLLHDRNQEAVEQFRNALSVSRDNRGRHHLLPSRDLRLLVRQSGSQPSAGSL
jgi:hypothetical protein